MESLIQQMKQLYSELSAQLLRLREEKGQMHKADAGNVDLAGPLIDRLNQCIAESEIERSEETISEAAEAPDAAEASRIEHHPPTDATAPPTAIPPLAPGKQVPGLSQAARSARSQPRVGEQLEKETVRYIAQALVFAKQGNVDAAEVYAQAAESAFKLAAQYLPEEEYRRFRDEVLSRLK